MASTETDGQTKDAPGRIRNVVFVWENLGPMHADRLSALSKSLGGTTGVIAIEFFDQSEVYAWKPVRDTGCHVETLMGSERSHSSLMLTYRLIRAALRVRNADYYLCHYERWPVFLAAVALRLAGRRVFALFNSKFDDYPRRLRTEAIKSILFLPYRGALCGSMRSREYLSFLGLNRNRVVTGYNTVSVDRIGNMSGAPPAPAGTPFEERDFIVVARFVSKKNLSMAIEAFSLWLEMTAHPRDLHLCGSGPLEAELRNQVAQLGIADRVHFHGFVQTEDVSRLLARSLCLILPSIEEQFGNVVIEAQAAGVPSLVSRVAGAADMLIDSGINGFVINPDGSKGCATLMAMLSEDKDRWSRFAIASYNSRHRGDVVQFVSGVRTLSELAAVSDVAVAV